MKIALVYDDLFLEHGPEWHPENKQRLVAILRRLDSSGLLQRIEPLDFEPASPEEIAWLHDPGYIEEVELLSRQGGGYLDLDTAVTDATYSAALLAAGGCMAAARAVHDGAYGAAICLVRPPGHHARRSQGMGFCIFNNAALAAEALIRGGAKRVGIVDWDAHHGNGTQELFYSRDDVLYISLHQFWGRGGGAFYPGTGHLGEIGTGRGVGFNFNIPMVGGAGHSEYMAAFEKIVVPALRAYRPEHIIISAGYDAHFKDPLPDLRLNADSFHAMARQIRAVAEDVCGGRVTVVLEGGYALDALALSVENTLLALWGEGPRQADDAPPPESEAVLAKCREAVDQAAEWLGAYIERLRRASASGGDE